MVNRPHGPESLSVNSVGEAVQALGRCMQILQTMVMGRLTPVRQMSCVLAVEVPVPTMLLKQRWPTAAVYPMLAGYPSPIG